jgi:hypothetical protein
MADVTETIFDTPNASHTGDLGGTGMVIEIGSSNLKLKTLNVTTSGTIATRAVLRNYDLSIIETATITANVANFTGSSELTAGTKYIITCDKAGASWTSRRKTSVTGYPKASTYITWVCAIEGTVDLGGLQTDKAYNITSIVFDYTDPTPPTTTTTTNVGGNDRKIGKVFPDKIEKKKENIERNISAEQYMKFSIGQKMLTKSFQGVK